MKQNQGFEFMVSAFSSSSFVSLSPMDREKKGVQI